MISKNGDRSQSSQLAELRRHELLQLGEELHLARQVQGRRGVRRRLGGLLIKLGQALGGYATDPTGTETSLAMLPKR